MAQLFGLCIHASVATGEFDHWHQVFGFGEPLPDWMTGDPARVSQFALLEASQPDAATLYACVDGTLSIRPPEGYLLSLDLDDDDIEDDEPEFENTLTLYLSPQLSKLNPDYISAISALAPASLDQSAIEPFPQIGMEMLRCFVYLNVDTRSVQDLVTPGLPALLDKTALTGQENIRKKRLLKRWRRFADGKRTKKVAAGGVIGSAGEPFQSTTVSGPRQTGFGVLTRYGAHDPGHFFDVVRGHLLANDAPFVDKLRDDVLGQHWPLIPDNADPATVGADTLYPYSALLGFKNQAQLSYADWRHIGNQQKNLYLERLLRRVRPDLTSAPFPPRFEFNMNDRYNLFQLEAITEYYMNDPDPWNISGDPVAVTDPAYQRAEFTSLYGENATASGALVTLHDAQDLARITVGLDVLVLANDTAETTRSYRILGIDAAQNTVTLNREPALSAASFWHIRHRAQLVLVDAFGARTFGRRAVFPGASYQITLLDLNREQLKQLKKINANFDTIELDIPNSDARTFRILNKTVNMTSAEAVLEVNYSTDHIPNSGVAWRIPAGVGGTRDKSVAWPRSAAKSNKGWWDHYDGLMFVIVNGSVEKNIPWSSYSSRSDLKYLTSIRGNQRYVISSYLSPKHSFIFKVTDAQSHLSGNHAVQVDTDSKQRPVYTLDADLASTLLKKSFNKSGKKASTRYRRITFYSDADQPFVRSSHVIKHVDEANNRVTLSRNSSPPLGPTAWRIALYDGVHEARDYFSPTVTPDTAVSTEVPPHGSNYLGKGYIRLHTGYRNKSGSQGCLISRNYARLRNVLSQAHELDYAYHYKTEPQKTLLYRTRSDEKHPPEGKNLERINKRIGYLKKSRQKWQTLLEKLNQHADSSGSVLAPLQASLDALADSMGDPLGDPGDETGVEHQMIRYDELFKLLDREQLQQLIYADEEALQALESIKPIRVELEALAAARKAEQARLGWWNELILANLWLVRPDERPEP